MTRVVAAHRETTGVERVFREVYGQAMATLVRVFGDITLAEDAVQEAFVVASDRWRREGIPANPAGWIVTTARNRAIDDLRRSARGRGVSLTWESDDMMRVAVVVTMLLSSLCS